jgi:hypothetical protein
MIPFGIPSEVSLGDFPDVISAVQDKSIRIDDKNVVQLSQLSDNFGFHVFLKEISSRERSPR